MQVFCKRNAKANRDFSPIPRRPKEAVGRLKEIEETSAAISIGGDGRSILNR